MTLRVAMWSGPRNISTAMLRSFENRPDTVVCDEPLYAFYLDRTGHAHPGAEEVIAAGETDWRRVARALTRELPAASGGEGVRLYYQKHMAQHLLPEVDRDWLWDLEHVFLIRDPREMLLSFSRVMSNAAVTDTGLPQQHELFEEVRSRTGRAPVVLDARDVLENPPAMLAGLCQALGIDFLPAMLSWPAGPRESDGIWAPHWYDAVNRSTGFEAWRPREGELERPLAEVLEGCLPYYRALHEHRLTV